MPKAPIVALSFAITVNAPNSGSIHTQTVAAENQPVGIRLSIAIRNNKVCEGNSPVVTLGVENLGQREIVIHDLTYRLHVEGEKGEATTTYLQLFITGKLRPGEAQMRADEYVTWMILPGTSEDRQLCVATYYDVNAPGKYSAYVEVMDPSSRRWVRTKTVKFETQSAPW